MSVSLNRVPKRVKGEPAIHHATRPAAFQGKWIYETEDREVTVMAVANGYAMVRRKGCFPYVCQVKELTFR